MSFGFAQPWHLFLPREGGHLVAIGGCGGREDFLSAMVAVYRDEGVAVAVATIGAGGASAPRGPTVAWSDLVRGWLPVCFFLAADNEAARIHN